VTPSRWKDDPTRRELLALYAEVDALLAGHSCDASADCCHFERTGREPYPTAIEVAEVEHAVAASGGLAAFGVGKRTTSGAGKTRLPVLGEERRCPLLSAEGRCRIYASRPFGCRTFFCDRAQGGKLPRDRLQALGRRVADLSSRAFVRDPGPRTLESALDRMVRGQSVRVDRR
jgi:Fe-S-cluster containining protein